MENEKKKDEMSVEVKVMDNEIPTLKSVKNRNKSEGYSVGTIDENMLNDEEKQAVEKYANEIDITDVNQIVKYGVGAQRNISDFSVNILKKVKTHNMGEIGESLKDLTVALDATMEPEKKGLFGIFQKAQRGFETIRANYAKAESNVERIEKNLLIHESVLIQDISMYQQMYDLNVQYYRELTLYIFAGKKALYKAKNETLNELKNKAESTKTAEDVQIYRDYEDLCHRFEKKLSDLETTRLISIQSAPQVRMLQNNDRELLDKVQSSLANTIPLWRNQLVLSLGIEHTKQSLDAQNELANRTNDLLMRNSETLKLATIETAKLVERPIVELETLHKCNNDLITSINEVIKIHNQGELNRKQVQEELVKIEDELKHAMLEAGN